MGYAQDILKILEHGKGLKDNDDDQRFYTSIYLNKELRVGHFQTIWLDQHSISRIPIRFRWILYPESSRT
jgi:hypothetical protein